MHLPPSLLCSLLVCSNRSLALLRLHKVTKALMDAEQCILLEPTWDKGHFRKAEALEAFGRLDDVRMRVPPCQSV